MSGRPLISVVPVIIRDLAMSEGPLIAFRRQSGGSPHGSRRSGKVGDVRKSSEACHLAISSPQSFSQESIPVSDVRRDGELFGITRSTVYRAVERERARTDAGLSVDLTDG